MSETIALVGGLLLTLFTYSYLVGDNPLYRLAVHLLVGVSAAYAAVIAIRTVILPLVVQIQPELASPQNLSLLIPLVLGLLLLFKAFRSTAWVGNTALGVLVTVGASVGLVGVISGTLIPQLLDFRSDSPILGGITAILTACVLLYFQFTGRQSAEGRFTQPTWQRLIRHLGHAVLMVTFGALFAGAISTSLVLLTDHLSLYLAEFVTVLGVLFS